MGGLQRFEQKLEQLVSGVFAKAFRSAVQPVEIAAALQREVDNNTQILSRDRRLVPNDFHVELAKTDLERLAPYDSAMASDMTEQLRQHAMAQSYVFPGPVQIHFEPAEDLSTGRFRIRSRAEAKVSGSDATPTEIGRARAIVNVNGTTHPLSPPGVVIGRGSTAGIRIQDPGISREHIQIGVSVGRVEEGMPLHLSVRDLGSTNGMLVDGVKVPYAQLSDGSTIKIGNTTMRIEIHQLPGSAGV